MAQPMGLFKTQRCSAVRLTGGAGALRCQAGKGFGKTSQKPNKPAEVTHCANWEEWEQVKIMQRVQAEQMVELKI